MKKLIALVLAVVCALGLVGYNNKTVNIDLPFEVGDVENIMAYWKEQAAKYNNQ